MTISGILATVGGLVVLAIIIKGFWSADKVEPIDQPDNSHGAHGSGNG
jgi:hypothetical protein